MLRVHFGEEALSILSILLFSFSVLTGIGSHAYPHIKVKASETGSAFIDQGAFCFSFSYSVYMYVRMYEKACVLLSTIDCYCKINHF